MDYNLEKNNNSKKLIIGISILFCTVILIVETTAAFFTQSDSETTGNIVSENINRTLVYNDNYEENNLYNRKALIPADLDVMLKTYRRTEEGKKCLDNNNHDSCSVYRFSIKNNSNASQELIMNLNPTANSYTNLKFILFEIKNNNPEQISKEPILLEKGNYTAIQLVDNFTLTPSEERMYELVFYIENKPNEDQTSLDAGKEFGAHISVDSITTGAYVSKQYGKTCWNVDPNEPSKLIAFNGISHDASIASFKDSVVESCSGYVEADEEGFIVTIPSKFNNVQIKTIGNMLLNPVIKDANGNIIGINKNSNIKIVIIQEGIELIENGNIDTQTGAFIGLGADFSTQKPDPNKTLEIVFPNSLTHIGDAAFSMAAVRELNLPSNLTYIGEFSFYTTTNLTTSTDKPLIIPASVETIELSSFKFASNLTRVEFERNNGISALKTIGQESFAENDIRTLSIPYSVTYIGNGAFDSNTNLTKLTFEGDLYTEENGLIIENGAFGNSKLTYLTEDDPLILPARISYIGSAFFANNGDPLTKSLLHIKYMGTRERMSKFNEFWHHSNILTLKTIEDQ